MRHRKDSIKLGRSPSHRNALVSSLVCGLIQRKRIRTTIQKARLARRTAEKMVTMARHNTLAGRRLVLARLGDREAMLHLFKDIAPTFAGRPGGYTRIIKIGKRRGDGADMVFLEWVGVPLPEKKKKKDAATTAK